MQRAQASRSAAGVPGGGGGGGPQTGPGDTLAEVSARRPLAYSTLADLVHHVRQHLPLSDLSLAVQLFAKNIDDESLPSSIQTMSCKLLLNLVDCIRSKSEQESGNGRDVLMRMLEVRCPAPPHGAPSPRLALCARLSALPAVQGRLAAKLGPRSLIN